MESYHHTPRRTERLALLGISGTCNRNTSEPLSEWVCGYWRESVSATLERLLLHRQVRCTNDNSRSITAQLVPNVWSLQSQFHIFSGILWSVCENRVKHMIVSLQVIDCLLGLDTHEKWLIKSPTVNYRIQNELTHKATLGAPRTCCPSFHVCSRDNNGCGSARWFACD